MGAHVLLVDDDTAIRHLLADVLEAEGYQLLTAVDGQGALELAEQAGRPVELLVTDVVMPGVDGVEVAKRVADLHPGVRVLFMSGFPRTADVAGALGPHRAFLHKPFALGALVRTAEELLAA